MFNRFRVKTTVLFLTTVLTISTCLYGCENEQNPDNNTDSDVTQSSSEYASRTGESNGRDNIDNKESMSQIIESTQVATVASMSVDYGLGGYNKAFQQTYFSGVNVPFSLSNLTDIFGNDYKKSGSSPVVYTWKTSAGDVIEALHKADSKDENTIYEIRCKYSENSISHVANNFENIITSRSYSYDEMCILLKDRGKVVQVCDDGIGDSSYFRVNWYGKDKECSVTFSLKTLKSISITIS